MHVAALCYADCFSYVYACVWLSIEKSCIVTFWQAAYNRQEQLTYYGNASISTIECEVLDKTSSTKTLVYCRCLIANLFPSQVQ